MVIFQMIFLVCKLYKLGFYITLYFGHIQCFIWEFLLLAFMKTERLSTTSFSIFSLSGIDMNFVCKLYMSSLYIKILILDIFEILDNIYVDRFLLSAFAKYILSQIYGHCILNCTFWYFLEIVKILFFEENIFKVFLFFYPKTSNFHISKMVCHRKLPNLSKNSNVLLISLQYTISFKWPAFAVICLVKIMAKVQSLKFKASVPNFPNSERSRDCNSLFKFVDSYWIVIMEPKKKDKVQLDMYFLSHLGFQWV